jgi:dTDP-4-dehydrorhamnose reductase
MKTIIFGSNGLIGNSLSKEISNSIKLSRIQCDITNHKKVEKYIKINKPDYIINCASLVGIKRCEKDRNSAIAVNADAVLNLSNLCRKYDITLVHISTVGVFGDNSYLSTENDIPYPTNFYCATKLLSEKYVSNNCHKYYIIRIPFTFSNPYSGGTIDNLIRMVLEHKKIDASCNHYYKYGYAKDITNGIVKIYSGNPYGIYHLYNEGIASIYNLLKYVNKLSGGYAIINKVKENEERYIIPSTMYKIVELRSWKSAIKSYLELEKMMRYGYK